MPLGRHSFMPDHFPCPGCRARRRVRSVLAGGIKSPLYLNFLPIQGRACWEMRWTGLRQISCNPSLCSQYQEHQTWREACFLTCTSLLGTWLPGCSPAQVLILSPSLCQLSLPSDSFILLQQAFAEGPRSNLGLPTLLRTCDMADLD